MDEFAQKYYDRNFSAYLKQRKKAAEMNGPLKEARQQLDLSQREVAEEIKISRSTYATAESMKRYPGVEIRKNILEFYNSKGIAIDEKQAFPEELKQEKSKKQYFSRPIKNDLQLETIVDNQNIMADKI